MMSYNVIWELLKNKLKGKKKMVALKLFKRMDNQVS